MLTHADPHQIRERVRRWLPKLASAIWARSVPLTPLQFRRTDGSASAAWQSVSVGHTWQGVEMSAFLRGQVTVPGEWAGERVALRIEISEAEPLLYLNGVPYQALDYNHEDVLLLDPAQGGESYALAIDAYARTRGATMTLRSADLVCVDRAAYDLHFDLLAALQITEVLPEDSMTTQNALVGLHAALWAVDFRGDETRTRLSYVAARNALADYFPYMANGNDSDTGIGPQILCAGHAHIDVAWLWSIANTRKKVGRTFASALRLMEEYPDYHFTQSQPQLYAYAKADYPDLYVRLQERVREGRWEPIGAMWVEADCNLPSGESLVRQILFGTRFFDREFNRRGKVLWLPDVFGCPGTLPQIMTGCGLRYFYTTKLSWAETNRFPHDTFWWRGIDGTEVLAHCATTPEAGKTHDTYNGQLTAWEIAQTWANYRQKAASTEVLHTFGWGDGGGGPTRQMLEMGNRFRQIPHLPHCRFGAVEPFFERLGAKVDSNLSGPPTTHLPHWTGELYLEFHRGTYTSQARTKQANRNAEILYRNAEIWASLALVTAGRPYPQAELNGGWEKILLNQFHDILPGSSIRTVYDEAGRDYDLAMATGRTALNAALGAIAGLVPAQVHSLLLFNPTDTLRPADVATVVVPVAAPGAGTQGNWEFADENDVPLPSQQVQTLPLGGATLGPDQHAYLVMVPEVGALGYQMLRMGRAGGAPEGSPLQVSETLLENEFVRVRFDANGEITSLVHKIPGDDDPEMIREREVIAAGKTANTFVQWEDQPLQYDAWNVDGFASDKAYPLRDIGSVQSIRVVESGPVRAGIEVVRQWGASTLTQGIYLYAHSPRLEFQTTVDWQERQMLLSVTFPVAINPASATATYDIAFGTTTRPTHTNTTWDAAQFEVCAHQWFDLSEGDYGVSVVSVGKYGCAVHDNLLRLTLLKGAIYPDPDADRGLHTFVYALLPHTGDWRNETVDEAHALNYPLLSRYVQAEPHRHALLPARYEFVTVDDQGIIVDTIKKAEDSDDLIVRLYETFNTRGKATLTTGFPIAEAWTVNLLEEEAQATEHGEYTIPFAFRPYEIKTFRIRPTQP